MAGVQFFETEDSIEEAAEAVVEATWPELKQIHSRLRRHMLVKALIVWQELGFVLVPDNYMEGREVATGD